MQVRTGIGETDMDGGPYRSQRPVERRAANRPEPAYRPPEEPQLAAEPPRPPAHRAAAPRTAEKEAKPFLKRFLWPIIVLIVLAVVGGWFAWSSMSSGTTAIDNSKYQAVFFSNGQVYFGKLSSFNSGYLKLTDIYYLQSQQSTGDSKTSSNPQSTSTDQNNVQLIKLGDEIHGPEDQMIISKDQVLFYENLKTDGKVAQSIKKFKDNK
jgi:hypothetical protein